MAGRTSSVEEYMRALDHPRKAEIERVRSIVRGANAAITERVKWNAPSFCIGGEDRVTMRLQPGDRVQLVFHRGAKPATRAFTFADPSGLLEWAASDRAVVTLHGLDDVDAKRAALTALVNAWIAATGAPSE